MARTGILIRVTAEERQAIEVAAHAAGVGTGQWARQAVIAAAGMKGDRKVEAAKAWVGEVKKARSGVLRVPRPAVDGATFAAPAVLPAGTVIAVRCSRHKRVGCGESGCLDGGV